jgi:hypothetical protein
MFFRKTAAALATISYMQGKLDPNNPIIPRPFPAGTNKPVLINRGTKAKRVEIENTCHVGNYYSVGR